MNSPSSTDHLRGRALFDAALAGVGGTLGGWAVFLLYVEDRDHLWKLLAALLIAALVALALEYLREVIREGHGELERHSFLPAGIAIVSLVITCELFVKAGAHAVNFTELLPAASAALVGVSLGEGGAPVGPNWLVLLGLVGIWCYMGIAAAQWLTVMVWDSPPDPPGSPWWIRLAQSAAKGSLASLQCALALLMALLCLRLFVVLADLTALADLHTFLGEKTSNWSNLLLMPFWFVTALWHFFLDIPGIWLDEKFGSWRTVPAAAMTGFFLWGGLDVLNDLRSGKLQRVLPDSAWGWFCTAAVLVALVGPLILIAPLRLVELLLLGGVVWVIPGLVLGGLIPFVPRLVELPGVWLGTALAAAASIAVAVALSDYGWFWWLVASLLLGAGLLSFLRWGSLIQPSRALWPVLPLMAPLLMIGPVLLGEQITYRMLGDMHTLLSLQPAPPVVANDPLVQLYLMRLTGPLEGSLEKINLERETDKAQKVLDLLQSGHHKFDKVRQFLGRNPVEPSDSHDPHKFSETKVAETKVGEQATEHPRLLESVAAVQEVALRVKSAEELLAQLKQLRAEAETKLQALQPAGTLSAQAVPAPGTSPIQNEPFLLPAQNAKLSLEARQLHDVIVAAHGVIVEVERRQHDIDDVVSLAVPASIHLSQILQVSISASFGFWATLSCLAAWHRRQGAHPPSH